MNCHLARRIPYWDNPVCEASQTARILPSSAMKVNEFALIFA
jgi:hypothetical protein